MDHFKKRCQGCNTLVAQYEIVCPPCLEKRRAKAVASAGPRQLRAPSWLSSPGLAEQCLGVDEMLARRSPSPELTAELRNQVLGAAFRDDLQPEPYRREYLAHWCKPGDECCAPAPWTVTPMDDLGTKRSQVIDALVEGVIDSAEGYRRMREIEVVRAENDRQQRMPPPGLQSGKAMMFPSRHRGRSSPVAGCTCDACKTIAACKWDNPYLSATVDAERAWRNAKLFGAGVIQKVETPAGRFAKTVASFDAIQDWIDAGFVSEATAVDLRATLKSELLKEPESTHVCTPADECCQPGRDRMARREEEQKLRAQLKLADENLEHIIKNGNVGGGRRAADERVERLSSMLVDLLSKDSP